MRRRGQILAVVTLLGAAGVFLALLALNLTNWRFYATDAAGIVYYIVLPAALAALVLAVLRLPPAWRSAVAVSLAAIVPALYAAEIFTTIDQTGRSRGQSASVDRRSKLAVILALRAAGDDAWPAMRARALLTSKGDDDGELLSPLTIDGRPVLPLASVPEARIVACNEAGRWETYDSDRHGFRNPPGLWDGARPGVALIGDSFVQGDCVGARDTIAARLPSALGPVVNLGVSGAGPLSGLAALVEYARPLAPPMVVWFFFEGNDVTKDPSTELRSALLRGYLDDGFGQNLISRPHQVASALRTYLDMHLEEAMARVDHPQEALLDVLKLYRLRESFGLDPIGLGLVGDELDRHLDLFARAIAAAKRRVEAWGGRLHFVYLPDSARYFGPLGNGRIRDWIREQVLATVRATGLRPIDIHATFSRTAEPRAFFRYAGSHYNEAGYRLVAATVALRLMDRPAGKPE